MWSFVRKFHKLNFTSSTFFFFEIPLLVPLHITALKQRVQESNFETKERLSRTKIIIVSKCFDMNVNILCVFLVVLPAREVPRLAERKRDDYKCRSTVCDDDEMISLIFRRQQSERSQKENGREIKTLKSPNSFFGGSWLLAFWKFKTTREMLIMINCVCHDWTSASLFLWSSKWGRLSKLHKKL